MNIDYARCFAENIDYKLNHRNKIKRRKCRKESSSRLLFVGGYGRKQQELAVQDFLLPYLKDTGYRKVMQV